MFNVVIFCSKYMLRRPPNAKFGYGARLARQEDAESEMHSPATHTYIIQRLSGAMSRQAAESVLRGARATRYV